VYLEGAAVRHGSIARDAGPRAVLNALERLAGGYDSHLAATRKDLAIAEGQLRDYEARIGKPFVHNAYQAELSLLRDQLKAGLSGAAPEQGAPPLPPVAEVAERIKKLKAENTIEAAPGRAGTRSASDAEEPVTARIRRHIEATLEPQPEESPKPAPRVAGTDSSEAAIAPPTAQPEPVVIPLPQPMAAGPSRTTAPAFRQRISAQQGTKARQLSLF
jgi:hypothetical protein